MLSVGRARQRQRERETETELPIKYNDKIYAQNGNICVVGLEQQILCLCHRCGYVVTSMIELARLNAV